MPVHYLGGNYDEPTYFIWECDQCGAATADRMIERYDGMNTQAFCEVACEVEWIERNDEEG